MGRLVVVQGNGCWWDGAPSVGDCIKVRWTDGELYGAIFRGVNNLDDYTVSSTPHLPC